MCLSSKNISSTRIQVYSTCDNIGSTTNIEGVSCECARPTDAYDPFWICNKNVQCGVDTISLENFTNKECICHIAEMPGCGLDKETGLINCGSLHCEIDSN